MAHVLVVEDDESFSDALYYLLRRERLRGRHLQEDKDEDRIEAAKRLAKLDPQAAEIVFRNISGD